MIDNLREGCGCKLCKAPVIIPQISPEKKALLKRARDDYRKEAWRINAEYQRSNF